MRNYGNDYNSRDDDFYLNGEYGTTSPVSLSAIGEAAASRVNSDTLNQDSLNTDYDYTNAQYNTDKAREQWQKDPSQRTADFKLYAKKWYNDRANYGRSQSDMIGDYNKLIDSMYDFKHGMAAPERSGANSYFYDDSVGQFNRNNRSAYASANTPGNVHGYDERQEDWNGSITAQRFIDRTNDDVTDFDWGFGDDDDEGYRALFSNLGKDRTGRYFITSDDGGSADAENDGSNTYTHPGSGVTGALGASGTSTAALNGDEYNDEEGNGGRGFDWESLAYIDATPEALRAMSLGQIQALNERLRKNKGLLNLQTPDHYETQQTRGLPDKQAYDEAGAETLHLASRNRTADSAQNMASMLDANNNAQKYFIQGKAADEAAYEKSLAANQTKNEYNRKQDYSTAMNNRNALYQKRVNDQSLEATYQRYKHDANQNYIDEIYKNLYSARELRNQQQKQYNSQSLRNDIFMNPEKYGIEWDDDTMDLMDGYMTGSITTEQMKKDGTYDKFLEANRQAKLAYDENWAKMNGLRYKGYHSLYDDYDDNEYESDPSKSDSMWDLIETEAKGGKVDTTEKIEIQKLRSKVSEMNAFQKHISKKVDTLEKDMDRLERSAAKYIQGMKIKV